MSQRMEVMLPNPNGDNMQHKNFEFPYDRLKLLDRITDNRDKHVETYEEAWKGYLIEVQEQLDNIVKSARTEAKKFKDWSGDVGKLPDEVRMHFGVNAQPPQSHKDEYERVIDMLAFTDEANVILSQDEFNQYVRDEWQWSRIFNETAGAYSTKFRASNA